MQNNKERIRNNCLNLIRILAASQVLFGHMVEHLELPINDTFFHATYFLRGVPIFFSISGFLIWFSIGRSRTYGQYLKKRFLRIYPELWIAVLIEVIILILLYHDWNLKQLILFTFGQASLFQFWTPDSLRGYGVGTPNGALWTINVMIQFYIFSWLFYKAMKDRKVTTWIIGFIFAFIISWIGDQLINRLFGEGVIGKLYDQTIIKYFWIFYIGMFIAEFLHKCLPFFQKYWHLFLLISVFFFWSGWDLYSGYYLLWSSFLIIGIIGFAYRFPRLSINPDISYGLFLYHMIVINVFVNYGWIKNWLYAIAAVIISILLAYISTVTVGKISKKERVYKKHIINS